MSHIQVSTSGKAANTSKALSFTAFLLGCVSANSTDVKSDNQIHVRYAVNSF